MKTSARGNGPDRGSAGPVFDAERQKRTYRKVNAPEHCWASQQWHPSVVHLCDVAQPLVTPREPDVLDAGFRPVNDIRTRLDQFEPWSQIAIRALFST
jgi:hypothetical protein